MRYPRQGRWKIALMFSVPQFWHTLSQGSAVYTGPMLKTVNYNGMIYHIDGSPEVYEEKSSTVRINSQGKVVSNEPTPDNRQILICCYHSKQRKWNIKMVWNGWKLYHFTRDRPIACIKQDATGPVAVELFTEEMTLGPTISRNPLRQVVDFM